MMKSRTRDLILDVSSIVVMLPFLALPLVSSNPLLLSLSNQIAIGAAAAMAIYIMLRLGVLSFVVPSFMAVGGYAAAIAATAGTTDLFLLMAISFVVPLLISLPLGGIVLRLRGVYFIFITFVANEILQIVLFETPGLTGGAGGIAGVPPASVFGHEYGTSSQIAFVTALVAIVAVIFTLAVTGRFRAEFSAIDRNETLAESLGAVIWKYRLIGFAVSAGVAGLAGFAMVNMLSTAHPSSFNSWSVNNYVAYVFIGGRGTMLGVVVGSALLIIMTNLFSGYAEYAAGLYGLLLVVVLTMAPGGIVGLATTGFDKGRARIISKRRLGRLTNEPA
jgi:branched-chain amino acid transport system permease protein